MLPSHEIEPLISGLRDQVRTLHHNRERLLAAVSCFRSTVDKLHAQGEEVLREPGANCEHAEMLYEQMTAAARAALDAIEMIVRTAPGH